MTKQQIPKMELDRLAKEAMEWIVSPDGQDALRENLRRATEIADKLQEAHRVNPKSLYEPFTV